MLVYGCRCAPVDLESLPSSADADYVLDYALLMFNRFTRGTVVTNGSGPLSHEFWNTAARVIQEPMRVYTTDRIEHPWLTDGEAAVIKTLRESYPNMTTDWYQVPRAILHASDTI